MEEKQLWTVALIISMEDGVSDVITRVVETKPTEDEIHAFAVKQIAEHNYDIALENEVVMGDTQPQENSQTVIEYNLIPIDNDDDEQEVIVTVTPTVIMKTLGDANVVG